MTSKLAAILAIPLLALTLTGCDSDTGGSDASVNDLATNDATTGDGGHDMATVNCGTPSSTCAPALGSQIDRMGRAGVNTALTDPFWDNGVETAEQHHLAQDKYNQASNPAGWGDVELTTGSKTSARIAGAIAAYDALNSTANGVEGSTDGCGDQLAYNATVGGHNYPGYTLLTTVLTDDELYVNTAGTTCTTYLAVEANTLGVTNTDCGGRTPTYNTIDITYTALVTGAGLTAPCLGGTGTCPVSNGITSDSTPGANQSNTTFPFLGDPL